MKKNKILLLTLVLISLVSIIIYQNILLNKELDNETNNHNITVDKNKDNISHTYDCKFTKTYNIVDLLDNYTTEREEYSYIVVDKFQDHNPIIHTIPSSLKTNLKTNTSYEFTYHIKGNANKITITDILNNIYTNHLDNNNLSVTLSIKETTKTGLDQIQEDICK